MPEEGQSYSLETTQVRVSPGLFVRRWFNVCVDLLFPPRCQGCGRVDEIWCAQCQQDLLAVGVQRVAHDPVEGIEEIAATAWHEGILREAVQGLKYGNVPELGAALGERLGARFVMANWTIDTIVPVPLHAMRLKERGYNQSQILSENMAQRLGLSCTPEALRREKYSQSQVGLSAVERKKNVEDAFSATPQLVEHRKILLVDDVCTTGSTLSVCAQALRAAGASQVYALTVTAAHG